MSRYRGPRLRIFKRLGALPGFGLKLNKKYLDQKFKKKYTQGPGLRSQRKKKSLYTVVRLKEKQKLRYHYGLTERKLIQYFKKARHKKISTSEILLHRLEMRLDNIVFRLGLAPTLPAARQLITHGHIFLNGKKRDIPSSECKVHDIITISNTIQNKIETKELPPFLNLDYKNRIGKVHQNASRDDIGLNINELLVIEYYSRK